MNYLISVCFQNLQMTKSVSDIITNKLGLLWKAKEGKQKVADKCNSLVRITLEMQLLMDSLNQGNIVHPLTKIQPCIQ